MLITHAYVHVCTVDPVFCIDLRIAQADLRIAQADLRFAQADLQIAQADLQITQADLQIAQADLRIAQANLRIYCALCRYAILGFAAETEDPRFAPRMCNTKI